MKIGYVMLSERGEMNRLLSAFAAELAASGLRLAGAVQQDGECLPDGKCDMDLRILPQGPVVRISQDLGKGARGCRLDPAALEQAVALTEAELQAAPPDLIILNKFGKHEAEGRGFRSTIAQALALDVPVLVGVNETNFTRFEAFTEGLAENAGNHLAALKTWFDPSHPTG